MVQGFSKNETWPMRALYLANPHLLGPASIILPMLKKTPFNFLNFLKLRVDCFFQKVYFPVYIRTDKRECSDFFCKKSQEEI